MTDTPTINLQYTIIREPLPDFIYPSLEEYTKDANRYHPQPDILREKLEEKYNQPSENIMLTSGIDEAIQLFAMAYGKNTVIFTPTYTVYSEIPHFGNNKLTSIPSLNNNTFSVAQMNFPDATLICLVNPNNPCGEVGINRIEQITRQNPQAMITVDEAYGEFVDYSAIPLTNKYPNIAVMRSFSKAYGMAGVRIGYVITQQSIISKLQEKTQWCNVSYLSVGAACAALDNEEYYIQMRKRVNDERDRLESILTENNFRTITSKINASLMRFESNEKALNFVNYLKRNNIIVSHGNGNSNFGLDETFVRISVGTPEQMAQVYSIIKEY